MYLYRILRAAGLGDKIDMIYRRAEVKAAVEAARTKSNALAPLRESLERATTTAPTAEERTAWQAIETRRSKLRKCTDTVEDVDYGAGYASRPYSDEEARAGIVTEMTVREYVSFSKDPIWSQALFYITRKIEPEKVLELGSCVGISGSYIASALCLNKKGRLVTIEGSPPAAAIARETFDMLGLSERVTVVTGPFHRTLEPCLFEHGPFDYVFVDGHHDGKATIGYFQKIKSHLSPNAIMIFDDVIWNSDMEQAWEQILSDSEVKDYIRLGGMGAVVL